MVAGQKVGWNLGVISSIKGLPDFNAWMQVGYSILYNRK
jgi:hypothetical protein